MSKSKILVVEDDVAVSQGVKRALELAGYECDIVNNVLAGILRMGDFKYDMAILDYHFEAFTGRDVEEYAEQHDLPTVFFTGADKVEGTKSPVVYKSQGPKELLGVIEKIIHNIKEKENAEPESE